MRSDATLSPVRPPEQLETERLWLRALGPGDGAALLRLFGANRARFADSFPASVSELTDLPGAQRYLASKRAEWEAARGFWFAVWERSSGALIGQVQLKRLDWSLGRAELAYLIDRDFEGRGLISEALTALLRVGFSELRLRKVFLRAIVGNARSIALARRLGFRHEGTLRQEFRTFDGTFVDLEYFGLLAGELHEPRHA